MQNPRCSATQIPARMGASAMGWMDPVTASMVTLDPCVRTLPAIQIPARMGASAMGWTDPVTASMVILEISVKH